MVDHGQMVMAGLWAKWKDPKSGDEVQSCTILTCGPNDVMAELHNRMPVILSESDWAKWLGEGTATEEELLAMLNPCPNRVIEDLGGGQNGRQCKKQRASIGGADLDDPYRKLCDDGPIGLPSQIHDVPTDGVTHQRRHHYETVRRGAGYWRSVSPVRYLVWPKGKPLPDLVDIVSVRVLFFGHGVLAPFNPG